MELEKLKEANRLAYEISKLQDIQTRLECGNGFYQIQFVAHKVKTLPDEYTKLIDDKETIEAYKKFIKATIKKLQSDFDKL